MGKVDVILGLQWGDEGKGKIVDYLADQYDLVCRFQGGPNAGHTIIIGSDKYVLHTIPSGIFREGIVNIIGNGVVLDPITLCKEIDALSHSGQKFLHRLKISRKVHLILPTHRLLDAASEASKGKAKIGSTLKGIGPTYMDKTGRNGLRIGDIESQDFKRLYYSLKEKHLGLMEQYEMVNFDLEEEEEKWFAAIERIREIERIDGEYFINEALDQGKRVLAEGAQGSMLDIDFGTYPYVTSSNTITAGVCTGLGIAPQRIGDVIGISKAYCTRVGSGPFPSELHDSTGDKLREIGHEFGATTGRPRRCGWIDIPQLKYTIMLNGVTKLVITKMDVLDSFETINAADSYSVHEQLTQQIPYDINTSGLECHWKNIKGWNTSLDEVSEYTSLPSDAKHYIEYLEKSLEVPVFMVSTGPERRKILLKH
jgi:adenylosuccinate synthase